MTPGSGGPAAPNAIGRMLGLLGDEWTLLLARAALTGASRYADFADGLPISDAVLAGRLRSMTRDGLLERRDYQQHPPRAAYHPTERCRALWPVLLSIWAWERRWAPRQAEVLPDMRHRAGGHAFEPVLCCRSCGDAVAATDLTGAWGPSGSWARSVPDAATRRRNGGTGRDGAGLFPHTMTVFGNRWSAAVIGASFLGVQRFSEYQVRLHAPTASLTDRLRALRAIGVLEVGTGDDAAERATYRLTTKGRAFFPVVATSLDWAERWLGAPEGPALVLTHRACGGPFSPALACSECAEVLRGPDVAIV